MSPLRRIVLIRHGETVGNSHERLHGSADLALSEAGRAQMKCAAASLRTEVFELVVASPMRRSWEAAQIVAGGAPIRLEHDFREIHFGRWEGMTKSEIEASNPVLFSDWQKKSAGFEYPGGEPRAEFRARVLRGLERLQVERRRCSARGRASRCDPRDRRAAARAPARGCHAGPRRGRRLLARGGRRLVDRTPRQQSGGAPVSA